MFSAKKEIASLQAEVAELQLTVEALADYVAELLYDAHQRGVEL